MSLTPFFQVHLSDSNLVVVVDVPVERSFRIMDLAKKVINEGGEVMFALLRLTEASAGVFPPLKSAAAGALHIVNLVKVCL